MKYAVIVTPQAERDIRDAFEYIADRDAFEYIAERSPANANRWLKGLYGMIDNLELMPRRFGRASEADYFP